MPTLMEMIMQQSRPGSYGGAPDEQAPDASTASPIAQAMAPQAPQGILSSLGFKTDNFANRLGNAMMAAGSFTPAETLAHLQKADRDAKALTLEELKLKKPTLTPTGQPGIMLATYPDGTQKTVVVDEAVAAHAAQQDRLDARQQAQLESSERRAQMAIDAADRRQVNMFGQQLHMLGAKNDAKTTAANQQKTADAMDSLELLGEAGRIVGDSTSSYFGNLVDKGAGLFGASTKGADTAARLKVLGGYLTSKVPKMSGPTSDKDMATYKEMAGSLGDPTVPLDQKKAAIDTMLGLNQKYAGKSNKVTPPSATGKTSNGISYKVED